jgi:WD40 repeat protein
LARLHAALQEEGPVGINPAALGNPTGVTGQGGIGKTQLAVAYAYDHQDEYPDGVYWLNAAEDLRREFTKLGRFLLSGTSDPYALRTRIWETLWKQFSIEEMRTLCFELDVNDEEFPANLGVTALAREITKYFERRVQLEVLAGGIRRLRGDLLPPQAQDEFIVAAFRWLRAHNHSLIILDNLAEPTTLDDILTRDCVPGRLPCRLLFTTRRRDLGRFRPVELKTLSPDAALSLLLRDARRALSLDPAHPEYGTARDICAMFGYLPLALEIAATHLAKFPAAPLAVYRDELRQRGALHVMTDRRVPVAPRHEIGLVAALAAQWATLGQEAQTLLGVAGQFPEAVYIPVARLGLLAGVPDKGHSFFDVTLDVALNELNDASLIEELAGDQLRLHPLVREFARDQTPLEEKSSFRGECVGRLLKGFGDIETLERQCDRRGIDALLEDLLAAQALLDRANGEQSRSHDPRTFLRVLRREAHNLRGWKQADAPAFLAQQLHNRLVYGKLPPLFGDLSAYLRKSRKRAWLARWAARRESPQLEMTLIGHKLGVLALAVTPDGRRVVSGGHDGVRVWNLETGETERILAYQEGKVNAVAVAPGGRRAVFGGDDQRLQVWNLDTGVTERTLTGHTGRVWTVVVTPNGRQVVSGGDDGILVWDLDKGVPERVLALNEGMVLTVAVTPDGRRIVSGGHADGARVWNLDTGAVEWTLAGAGSHVEVAPDGRHAVSIGTEGLLVWNLDTGKIEETLPGSTYRSAVFAMAVTPDGRQVISGGYNGLQVWNLETGKAEQMLSGHAGRVDTVVVTPDGRQVVSGGRNGVRVWSLETGETQWMLTGHEESVDAVAVTPNRQCALSSGGDGVRVWNLDTGKAEQTLARGEPLVKAIAVMPDGKRAVFGGAEVRVWNLDTSSVEQTLREAGLITALVVTADGHQVVTNQMDAGLFEYASLLRVWNLDTGMIEQTLRMREDIMSIAVASEGQRIICGDRTGTLWVWNLSAGIAGQMSTGHQETVRAVAVTPDGRLAVTGSSDRTLRVWNLDVGKIERILTGHKDEVTTVAVTPDKQWVISSGHDGTLRLWDLGTGCESICAALDASVECVAVAPDRPLTVVAGDAAGNVYCLELIE